MYIAPLQNIAPSIGAGERGMISPLIQSHEIIRELSKYAEEVKL